MKRRTARLGTILAVLVLSSGVALAQGGGGSGGGSGGGAGGGSAGGGAAGAGSAGGGVSGSGTAATQSGAGASTTAPGTQVNGPNNTGGPVPGLATSPSDHRTVGRAPGVNPGNPQDATHRGNPSDRTLPGARNPQDMKTDSTGTPVIIKPEK
jgi:hypothetical protein